MAIDTEQLTLFDTIYSVTYTTKSQVQDWPLPAAQTLEEATDAARGLGLFLMFNQGILWGPEWDDEESSQFVGIDQGGHDVSLKVSHAYRYGDWKLCE